MMKRLFTLLFAASCLTAVGQVPDYVPTEGLVAWYSLAENGEDASGNGHDLIQVGAPIWTIDDAGSYCDFDGEGTHFYHPQALFPEVEELTISFWARIDDFSTGSGVGVIRPIISKHYSSLDGSFIIHPSPQFVEDYQIELGVWHHITKVVSEVNKIYVDGELVNSSDNPTNGWNPTNHPFMIGGWLNSPWWSNSFSNVALTFDGGMSSVGLWSRELSPDEISSLFSPVSGCMHEQACNYSESANLDDGTCEFVSCHCLVGTVWDPGLGGCIGDGSGDINLDGCVQLNDLLDLLSAFGNCGVEESAWQCGDPLEYQGFNYATVQIGEQCWFAENLRSENYRNGDPIPSGLDNATWQGTTDGAVSVSGENVTSLSDYGHLYNWYAVDDYRSLCPIAWHVPDNIDWMALEVHLGMTEEEAMLTGWRGSDQGFQLKSDFGWTESGNGSNASQFGALPAGGRDGSGLYGSGFFGAWWSNSTNGSLAWLRSLDDDKSRVNASDNVDLYKGFSIRCIQDAD